MVMKIREIKELTTSELQEQLVTKRDELNRLEINHAVSPLDNPSLIRENRRTIARFMTELRQRQMNQQ